MNSTPWIAFSVSLLGVITFLYRYSFISSQGRKIAEKIPQGFLKLLAPATFTAIIINNMIAQRDNPEVFQQKLFVVGLSVFIAYFTKSIMLTLIFGLGLLFILQNF